MKSLHLIDRQSAKSNAITDRLHATLSVACLAAAVALTSPASNAEPIQIATAPATASNVSAGQIKASAQYFDTYDAAVRSELQKITRYPNRSATASKQPEGTVGVAFEINGNGDVLRTEITQASHSKILDSAALASVRWAKYPAFASHVPSTENSRRYAVVFDFRSTAER